MSEISAAYILQYLEDNFDKIINHHTKLYKHVKTKFSNYKLYPNYADSEDKCVLSCFCFLDSKFTPEYVTKLIEKGIMCRKYYHPLESTKVATEIFNDILCYPCNMDIDKIILL